MCRVAGVGDGGRWVGVRRQGPGAREQRSAVRGQRDGWTVRQWEVDGRQRTGVRGQVSGAKGQRSAVRGQRDGGTVRQLDGADG